VTLVVVTWYWPLLDLRWQTVERFRWHWLARLYRFGVVTPIGPRPIGIPLSVRTMRGDRRVLDQVFRELRRVERNGRNDARNAPFAPHGALPLADKSRFDRVFGPD
jgi:hypothetical protein